MIVAYLSLLTQLAVQLARKQSVNAATTGALDPEGKRFAGWLACKLHFVDNFKLIQGSFMLTTV